MGGLHIIPSLHDLGKTMQLVEQYDVRFEYNDFYIPEILTDEYKVSEIIRQYELLGRDCTEDTLHGAFFDVTICSRDSDIRRISRDRIVRSVEIGVRLGVRAVIVHTNYIAGFNNESYVNGWIEDNAVFFNDILSRYKNISIYMENMWDDEPYILRDLYNKMDNPRFGICLDVAHANLHTCPIATWFRSLGTGIRHMHINDNDRVSDLHETVGSMTVDWNTYDVNARRFCPEASVLIEVNDPVRAENSIRYLQEQRCYPFV